MIKIKIAMLIVISLIFFSCDTDDIVPTIGHKVTITANYTGDAVFNKIAYAVFKGKNTNATPVDVGRKDLSNEDLQEPKTFATKGTLLNGEYTIIVYGDVDESDGMLPTLNDPIGTAEFEIKDADASTTMELKKGMDNNPLACMSKTCSSNDECNCDANFCIPQEASHAGNYEISKCTITGCSSTNPCPPTWSCIENPHGQEGNLNNPKSFCAKEKATTNNAKIKLTLQYNGEQQTKVINIAITKEGENIPVKVESIKKDENITFPFNENLEFDIDNGEYTFIAYADVDTNDGYLPKDKDPQATKKINLEREKETLVELQLEEKK